MNIKSASRRRALRRAVAPIIETLEGRQYLSSTVANFTGGSGTSLVDQFAGKSGSGWTGAWTTQISNASLSGSVISTTPLNSGGNYLHGTDTNSAANGVAAWSRQYGNFAGGVQLNQVHTISWDFRADDASLAAFTSTTDRYTFFENTSATTQMSGTDNWTIAAYGANPGMGGSFTAKNFVLLNGSTTSILLGDVQGVDTGITLTAGTVYHFSVTTDPTAKTWCATITDGTAGAGHTFTSGTLNWRNYSSNPTASGGYVHFSPAASASGETRTFSIDNVSIAPQMPEATGVSATFVPASAPHVDLAWTDNAMTETGYYVMRKAPGEATFSTLATLAADSTSYTDTTANSVGTYTYRIDAYQGSTTSASSAVTVVVSPDDAVGTTGSGWASGWTAQSSNATLSGSIVSTTPLNSGGNYLQGMDTNTTANGTAAWSRQYNNVTGGVQLDQAHTLTWDFRADDASLSGFTTSTDRYTFFENNVAANQIAGSNSWTIGAFGANPGIAGNFTAQHFILFNGTNSGTALNLIQGVDTGITLTAGVVYHFTVRTDPTTKTWTATITDGTPGAGHTFTSGNLKWRNYGTLPTASGGFLQLSSAADGSSEFRAFSIDSVAVAAGPVVPAPSLTLNAGNSQNVLNWTAVSGASSYNLYRSTTAGGESGTPFATGLTGTSYIDSAVTSGTTYYYKFSAVSTTYGEGALTGEFVATPTALPTGWSDGDIGSPALPGSASVSGDTFTLTGTGSNIYGTSDQFHYAYTSLTGDGEIITQLTSQKSPGVLAKAGIMFRDGTAANAAWVMLSQTNGQLSFQDRPTAGTSMDDISTQSSVNPPIWLKLTRIGNLFTAFSSTDGTTWTTVGSRTLSMASTMNVGLALDSYTSNSLNKAVFSNTSVTAGTFPLAPMNVVAAALSETKIAVRWDPSAGATSYIVKRSVSGGAYQTIATVTGGQVHYTDTSMQPGETADYEVFSSGDQLSPPSASQEASANDAGQDQQWTVTLGPAIRGTTGSVDTDSLHLESATVSTDDPENAVFLAVTGTVDTTYPGTDKRTLDFDSSHFSNYTGSTPFTVVSNDVTHDRTSLEDELNGDSPIQQGLSSFSDDNGNIEYYEGYIALEDLTNISSSTGISNDHDYDDYFWYVTVTPVSPAVCSNSATNGQADVTTPQLSSNAPGSPLDVGQSISNMSGTDDGSGGVFATATGLPSLRQADSDGLIRLIQGGSNNQSIFSLNSAATHYTESQGGLNSLNHGTETFTYTDTAGNSQTYYDFSSSVAANLRGKLISETTAGGIATTVLSTNSAGQPTDIQITDTTDTAVENWVYTYLTGSDANVGRLSTVTQQIKDSSGDWTTYRQMTYSYYDGTQTNGTLGDLMRATVTDGSGNTIDDGYYRYYTAGESGGNPHQLKYAFTLTGLSKLQQAYSGDSLESLTDTQVSPYADVYQAYDAGGRIVTRGVQGEGCSVCSGGIGTYTYSYESSTNAVGYNSWSSKETVTKDDGTQTIIYSDAFGLTMLTVNIDGVTGIRNATFYVYDGNSRQIMEAEPAAVNLPTSLSTIEAYADLLHQTGTNSAGYPEYQYLNNTSGLINLTDYASTTTATATTAGDVAGYETDSKIEQGDTGSPVLQSSTDYYQVTAGGSTIDPIADSTQYRNTDGTGAETTSYSYTFYSGTVQMESETTSLPVVTTTQNGPGTADVSTQVFNLNGNVIWSKDADGFITYNAYDPVTDTLVRTIQDVNTSNTSDFDASTLPSGWSTPTGGGLNLVTIYEVDSQGRTTEMTDPNGNVTYTVYNDGYDATTGFISEVRTYTDWHQDPVSGLWTTTGPVHVSRTNEAYGYAEYLTYAYTPESGLTAPTGTDTITNIQSLSRDITNAADQVVESDSYFDLTGLTYSATSVQLGTAGTNYYATIYQYDDQGRQNKVVDPTGTITRTVYDGQGQVLSIWIGTDDTPTSGYWSPTNLAGTNMVEVSSNIYDNNGSGDGNLTQTTQYPNDGSADRVSDYFYDWRDREVATKAVVESSESTSDNTHFITYTDYDNLGEVTAQSIFDGDNVTIGSSGGVPSKPSSSLLKAYSTTAYDNQGRAYQTTTFNVDPSSGSVSSGGLVSNSFYDHRGNVIKQSSTAQPVQKMVYDGAGRETIAYTTDGGGDTVAGSAGAWSDAGNVTGDIVLEQDETLYDADGNAIMATDRQRFDDATDTGALGDPSSGSGTAKARVSYDLMYYDAANRQIAEVNVGTNGGTTSTSGGGLNLSTDSNSDGIPDVLQGSVPSGSDDALVTSYSYDAAGNVQDVTDPRGIVTRTYYDALNRTTKTIADYTDGTPTDDSNQTTEYTYDGDGDTLTMTAVLPSSTFQETQYVYGATTSRGDSLNANNVLIATRYPDPTTGEASTGQEEDYTTNALGQRTSYTDRNGNGHLYSYDMLGRQTSDTISTLGSGVDGAVRRIDTAYNSQGQAYQFTSYADTTGTTVVNQVQDVFNGLGQLTTEYQATTGAVNSSSTPSVQYGYDTIANGSRMTSMTYPNGRVLDYNYGTSGSLNDTISRLDSISDSSATLESYKYLGLSTVVERDHPQDGVNLTYIGIGTGDAGDKYVGLDRFGRVVDQNWTNGTSSVDEYTYTYDRDGNVLTKSNALDSSYSEAYSYDDLNRLTDDTRNGTDHQSFDMDALGNDNSVTTDGTTQDHSTNDQNELTDIGGTSLTYDANGNETTDDAGNTLVYDAWNQLVVAKSGGATLITYSFDALGRRVTEGSTSIYFSGKLQEIEDRNGSGSTTQQLVYSPVFVNAYIERDRDTDNNGTLDERMYLQQDANYDVTAIATTSGTITERFVYDAYGTQTVLSAGWAGTTDSYGLLQGFQGEKTNPITGLLHDGQRDDSVTQDRWMQEDPRSYINGLDLYAYCNNSPENKCDPEGTDFIAVADRNIGWYGLGLFYHYSLEYWKDPCPEKLFKQWDTPDFQSSHPLAKRVAGWELEPQAGWNAYRWVNGVPFVGSQHWSTQGLKVSIIYPTSTGANIEPIYDGKFAPIFKWVQISIAAAMYEFAEHGGAGFTGVFQHWPNSVYGQISVWNPFGNVVDDEYNNSNTFVRTVVRRVGLQMVEMKGNHPGRMAPIPVSADDVYSGTPWRDNTPAPPIPPPPY